MHHRIPPAEREVLPGVILAVSTMGGCSIVRAGDYIGWIHASIGDQWNAYVRRPGSNGDLLGRFNQEGALPGWIFAMSAGSSTPVLNHMKSPAGSIGVVGTRVHVPRQRCAPGAE